MVAKTKDAFSSKNRREAGITQNAEIINSHKSVLEPKKKS